MMYRVFISLRAERNLKSIPKRERSRIIQVIESLKTSYFPEHFDIKKLKGYRNSYRIRVGGWRIIYQVDFEQREILVGAILLRKHAYTRR